MRKDVRTQYCEPCTAPPINAGHVNLLDMQDVFIPLRARKHTSSAKGCSAPYREADDVQGSISSMCQLILSLLGFSGIPARLQPSPTTGELTCSMSATSFNATTCPLHDTLQICASCNRWQSPKASCQSIPLTFLFSSVLSLHWESLLAIVNAEKNCSYLIHEARTVAQLFSIPQIGLRLSDSSMTFISPFSSGTSQGELAI